ncbi:MAG TPA: hypothetical protein VMT15_15230 [Bryobacteraceae bacterium]|nr:hypothetical protein [Bryobacteraceae bacterium]
MGPLTGFSFIGSVRTYSEISAGVGEALSPLTGVWAPTFSACELAAVFLLPFVAIRMVGGDRESGALKLELQQSLSTASMIAAKTLVLLLGWLIAMLPPISAMLLWRSYGGSVYPPELMTLILGHILNAGLTIGLAAAMASLAEHHATAAILTLSVTVGTWVISLLDWGRAAEYTPAAMVAQFQHGLIRLDVICVVVVLIVLGLGLAAIWMRLGVAVRRRIYESIALAALVAVASFGCSLLRPSWDASEGRRNSLPEPDERVLRQIHGLTIEVHLASEDPRRVDLENRALSKLRRAMPDVRVTYIAATSTGLFEQASAGYGEIWYELGGRRTMSRATTAEAVLESIYAVAQATPPAESEESIFRGHPLAAQPRGAALVFYALWPCVFLACGILIRRSLK